ncbi:MAG: hypothetical protein AB8C02_17230 [Halioglobus sp.]
MSSTETYNIVISGKLVAGKELDPAVTLFAETFKIARDKAEPYFQGEPKLLRKNLDAKQAKAYESALANIGLEFEVQLIEAKPPLATMTLAMEEITDQSNEQDGSTMLCPKCRTEQPMTQTCSSCGIIIEKYRASAVRREIMDSEAVRKPSTRWWKS